MKRIFLFLLIALPVLMQAQTSGEIAATLAGQSLSTSGNITIVNSNPLTGTPTAGSFLRLSLVNQSTAVVTVSGTYTGALSAQYSTDGGTTWITFTNANIFVLKTTGVPSATIASATVGAWAIDVVGLTDIRITALAAVTGTAVVSIKAVTASQQLGINQALPVGTNSLGNIGTVTTLTQFPAAGATGDAQAGPSPTWIKSIGFLYNGTTYDRYYDNYNTTTGDAGAKTTTFNGATQTNFNARGAMITVSIGAVTGTTPSLAVQPQVSYDAGTTWINYGLSITAISTASTTYSFFIYPTNLSSSAGTTAVNLAPGTTSTQNTNAPLPRTWRLSYTIAGTTPSFTLTGVYVNYML